MVNQIVLEYLKKYGNMYKLEDLKAKILSKGYSEADFEEAAKSLGLKTEHELEKQPGDLSRNSKGLWLAGLSGIIALSSMIIFSVFNIILSSGSLPQQIASHAFMFLFFIFSIFFFYGFIILGKRYDKKLIRIVSFVFIVLSVLSVLFQVFVISFPETAGNILFKPLLVSFSENPSFEGLMALLGYIFVILIVIFLFYIVLGILFGIGLITLRQVRYSKIAGILDIIGFFTLIIGIGALLLLISFVFKIVMLFNESKRSLENKA